MHSVGRTDDGTAGVGFCPNKPMAKRRALPNPILEKYDSDRHLYAALCDSLVPLIDALLSHSGIRVHSITKRVKDRGSLDRKISKEGKSYTSLSEVTDVVGIRIITYLADDVDKVAELIEREFEIDRDNSVDKRAALDPDRFGYLSLHHVVSLSDERSRLTEYRRFPGLKAEIQTRSILQHAWAEIEHDLGYKSTLAVPRDIRRRFSRLAGLLELADQEFVGIREELQRYEASVTDLISTKPQEVELNSASLNSYVVNSALISRLDREIAVAGNSGIVPSEASGIQADVERLAPLGFTSIRALDEAIQARESLILQFARLWLTRDDDIEGYFSSGVALFYFWYVLLGESGEISKISAALKSYAPESNSDYEQWAQRIVDTLAKAKSS